MHDTHWLCGALAVCMALIPRGCLEQEAPFSVRQLTNKNSRFIYASSPISGLDVVLEHWREIRRAIIQGGGKEPTLEILFSFDSALDARYGGAKWYALSLYGSMRVCQDACMPV